MENYGFIRVAAASPRVKVADIEFNINEIISMIEKARRDSVSLLAFPELSVTGYTCADLFGQQFMIEEAERGVKAVALATKGTGMAVAIGVPIRIAGRLYNCAAVVYDGSIKGIVPKVFLPSYDEFYETRWFASGEDFMRHPAEICYAGEEVTVSPSQIFNIGNARFAVEICEDVWTPVPPSSFHALAGANIILNLSASNEVLMKHTYRKSLVDNQSARTISAYVYSSCGFGESTQDLVYAGSSLIYENGTLLAENERFQTESSMIVADVDLEKLDVLRQKENTFGAVAPDGTPSTAYRSDYKIIKLGNDAGTDFEKKLYRHVEAHPFVPGGNPEEIDRRAREITSIQVLGLASRLEHIGSKTAVIGISGGLDSTLALLITVLAFDKLGLDRKGIIGVTMPGFGTTDRTYHNAVDLMAALGITNREISIVPAVKQHFSDIGQDIENHDVTYENSQARERTQLLMDIANKENGIVVGTGDLSELALGWATYNGDHMSMYGVNSSIPKTLVKYLVEWAARTHFGEGSVSGRSARDILLDVVDTPISPELTPADEKGNIQQKTEDLVGPYELHDFFLYNFFRFGYAPEKVFFLSRKAFGKTYDDETIKKWLRKFYWRFFSQQFKRSCLPDGPKVGSVTLSPRGDWRMPSDAKVALWIDNLK